MTRGTAIEEYINPALKRTWNDKVCEDVLKAIDEEVITNQKWLALISPEEWVRVIHWLYHDYGTRFADSEGAIIQWLRKT